MVNPKSATRPNNAWHNHVVALAGIFQACKTVEQLAKTGYLKTDSFKTAVNSLFETQPDSVESVFGSIHQLEEGFETLIDVLQHHRDMKNRDLLRYALGVLHLQKILSRRKELLYVIGNRLEKAKEQVEHFDLTHDNVIANIADIYMDTISKFSYRIQVTGDYNYLQQQRVANQIRVLLLAAIRAATLWRQVGGSRWQFLFYRAKLVENAEELYKQSRQVH